MLGDKGRSTLTRTVTRYCLSLLAAGVLFWPLTGRAQNAYRSPPILEHREFIDAARPTSASNIVGLTGDLHRGPVVDPLKIYPTTLAERPEACVYVRSKDASLIVYVRFDISSLTASDRLLFSIPLSDRAAKILSNTPYTVLLMYAEKCPPITNAQAPLSPRLPPTPVSTEAPRVNQPTSVRVFMQTSALALEGEVKGKKIDCVELRDQTDNYLYNFECTIPANTLHSTGQPTTLDFTLYFIKAGGFEEQSFSIVY